MDIINEERSGFQPAESRVKTASHQQDPFARAWARCRDIVLEYCGSTTMVSSKPKMLPTGAHKNSKDVLTGDRAKLWCGVRWETIRIKRVREG